MGDLELVMHTTARSVQCRRKTEMGARRLSTWAVQKLICSMSGKNTASKRDDNRVTISIQCCHVCLLLHLGNIIKTNSAKPQKPLKAHLVLKILLCAYCPLYFLIIISLTSIHIFMILLSW